MSGKATFFFKLELSSNRRGVTTKFDSVCDLRTFFEGLSSMCTTLLKLKLPSLQYSCIRGPIKLLRTIVPPGDLLKITKSRLGLY